MEGSAWIISLGYKEDCAARRDRSVAGNAKVWVNLLLLTDASFPSDAFSRNVGNLEFLRIAVLGVGWSWVWIGFFGVMGIFFEYMGDDSLFIPLELWCFFSNRCFFAKCRKSWVSWKCGPGRWLKLGLDRIFWCNGDIFWVCGRRLSLCTFGTVILPFHPMVFREMSEFLSFLGLTTNWDRFQRITIERLFVVLPEIK